MTVTVHPRDRSVSIAGRPVPTEGADPPDWSNTGVPAAIPDATRDTRMLSMLVWVRAVIENASAKFPPLILSKALAGNVVRLSQFRQALLKSVPADMSIKGKLVRLSQLSQVKLKLVPADVLIRGKLVRLVQLRQALLKSVPADVLIKGKLVRLPQLNQAKLKSVPADVSIRGNEVSSVLLRQKLVKSVTAP